jgi:MFS superfamily sulfate permease-like transporter
LAAKVIYAVVVTFIMIFATIALSRDAERAKKLEEESDKGLLGLGSSNKE